MNLVPPSGRNWLPTHGESRKGAKGMPFLEALVLPVCVCVVGVDVVSGFLLSY